MLTASGKKVEIINYMKTPFTIEKLSELIELLGIKPIELIRTNETLWKEKYNGKNMRATTLIKLMVKHPNLIQRPIVVDANKAVIARSPEVLNSLL
jgi:arsenate reductase